MLKLRLHGLTERAGFLLTVLGASGMLIGVAFALPAPDRPPNRPEFDAAVSQQWHDNNKAASTRSKNFSLSKGTIRPSAGIEEPAPLEELLEPLPLRDPHANWTVATYVEKTLDNLVIPFDGGGSWSQLLFSYGAKAFWLGLFIWFLFHRIFGRVYRWVRHRNSEQDH